MRHSAAKCSFDAAFVNLGASCFITVLTLIAEVAGGALALELASDVESRALDPAIRFLAA